MLDCSAMTTYNNKCSEYTTIKTGGENMENTDKIYLTASEVASMLGVSVGHSYKLVKR